VTTVVCMSGGSKTDGQWQCKLSRYKGVSSGVARASGSDGQAASGTT